MNAPNGPDPTDVDLQVKSHLDRLAARLDTRELKKRILDSQNQPTLDPGAQDQPTNTTQTVIPTTPQGSVHRRTWLTRGLGWGLLTAAAALLAFLGGLQVGPSRASASDILREAQKAHQLPIDRCYLVEVRFGAAWRNEEVPPPPDRVSRLWTRGDQFWMESFQGRGKWAWGRDETGGIWMALGEHRGIRIEKDEVPRWLEMMSDVQSMKLETLLSDVLTHFWISEEATPVDSSATTYTIQARPKLGPWLHGLRSVTLEVDTQTKALKKVVIARLLQGQPLATTTYTLIETDSQPDEMFQLEGHLTEPYQVFTKTHQAGRRAEILSRVYGPQAGRLFQLMQRGKQ